MRPNFSAIVDELQEMEAAGLVRPLDATYGGVMYGV
jgi:hypothetical protein